MLYWEHYIIWFRDLDSREIAKVIGGVRSVVLEENGEDEMERKL